MLGMFGGYFGNGNGWGFGGLGNGGLGWIIFRKTQYKESG
jgi:hypothetical protein